MSKNINDETMSIAPEGDDVKMYTHTYNLRSKTPPQEVKHICGYLCMDRYDPLAEGFKGFIFDHNPRTHKESVYNDTEKKILSITFNISPDVESTTEYTLYFKTKLTEAEAMTQVTMWLLQPVTTDHFKKVASVLERYGLTWEKIKNKTRGDLLLANIVVEDIHYNTVGNCALQITTLD